MDGRKNSGPGPCRGITLIEMLVVVALASMALALVFPAVGSGLTGLQLRSSAQRLAASAKFARDQAVYRQRFFQLEIDGATGTVSVLDLEGNFRRSFDLPEAVRVERILPEQSATPLETRRFLFFPDGSLTPFQVILRSRQRRVQVSADPLTGFPEVLEL